MSAKIHKLFENVKKLPQVPEVVKVLINQFNDPNINLKEIARNVEKEQVISLKVLRIVNSAYFSLPKKIVSIEDAVVMLGMGQLRSLVIASGIVSAVPKIENFDIKQFWLSSFTTANYAKWLANESQCDADTAFTAGLIGDLGHILIRIGKAKHADQIEQLVEEGKSRVSVEKMRLGFTTQDVSAELCRLWKFSDDLIIPIEQSAEPLLAEPVSKMACVICIARYISQCKNAGQQEEDILQNIPMEVAEPLGLSETFFKEKIAEILALESGLDGLIA